MNSTRLRTNDPMGSSVPSTCPHALAGLGRSAPPTSRMAAPASGSAMISQSSAKAPSALVGSTRGISSWRASTSGSSVLQQAGVVDRGRPARPEDGHDDREPDDDLGRGHHHHEEGGDLALEVAVLL